MSCALKPLRIVSHPQEGHLELHVPHSKTVQWSQVSHMASHLLCRAWTMPFPKGTHVAGMAVSTGDVGYTGLLGGGVLGTNCSPLPALWILTRTPGKEAGTGLEWKLWLLEESPALISQDN